MLIKLKENCLSINGKQSVQLEEGTIEFQNYFKQIPVPFKIYADFECNLKDIESYEGSCTTTFLVVLLAKLFVLMINLVNQLLFIGVKMLLINLLKQFLKTITTVKK